MNLEAFLYLIKECAIKIFRKVNVLLISDENSFDLDCVGWVVSGLISWRQVVAPVKNIQVSVTAKRGFLVRLHFILMYL
jgi:hypothetical protein